MADVWRGRFLKLFQAQKEKVSLSANNGETHSGCFFPPDNLSSVPESNPNLDDESECKDTSVAKKGRKFCFRAKWPLEFDWLRPQRAGFHELKI